MNKECRCRTRVQRPWSARGGGSGFEREFRSRFGENSLSERTPIPRRAPDATVCLRATTARA